MTGDGVHSRPGPPPVGDSPEALEARYLHMAEVLDRAGLGPGDYLYWALKARLPTPRGRNVGFRQALRAGLALVRHGRPHVPSGLTPAPILAASSYTVSAQLMRRVVSHLAPGEAVLCEVYPEARRSGVRKALDAGRAILSLPRAMIFAKRVQLALRRAGFEEGECNTAAGEALRFCMYRRAARAIIRRTKPKCLVVGNGNRHLELSLWAEARARGIPTALLPYMELFSKPARIFSLCRGGFELAFPFSNSSAEYLRKLSPEMDIVTAGYPVELLDVDTNLTRQPDAEPVLLYIAGNDLEPTASAVLREAFEVTQDYQLRVRMHPRAKADQQKDLFGWLDADQFSYSGQTSLASDLSDACIVVTVRSTVGWDAMLGGLPVIWLSPGEVSQILKKDPRRVSGVTLLEVTNASQLREAAQRLIRNPDARARLVREQNDRLRALGFINDYFPTVTSALRRHAGLETTPS